jgi:hypothetical protein
MKKLPTTLIVFTALFNLGCEQESIEPANNGIKEFKAEAVTQFRGKVLNEDIYWKDDESDNGIDSYCVRFWCVTDDKSIQQRILLIYDYKKTGNVTTLKLTSPAFSIHNTDEAKKAIFDVGKKDFHLRGNSIYDGFTIDGEAKEICFSTAYGEQNDSSFEIVQMHELPADFGQEYQNVRVWVMVSCTLYDCDGHPIGKIENGRFVAEIQV